MGENVIPRVSFFRQDDVFNLCYDRHWSTVPMLLHDLKLTRLLTLMYRARASLKTIHQKGYFQGGTQPELSCCARTRSWECSLLTGASARKFSEHHKRGKFPRRFYQDSLYSGTPKSFKVDLPTEELFIKEDQAAWLTHAWTCSLTPIRRPPTTVHSRRPKHSIQKTHSMTSGTEPRHYSENKVSARSRKWRGTSRRS